MWLRWTLAALDGRKNSPVWFGGRVRRGDDPHHRGPLRGLWCRGGVPEDLRPALLAARAKLSQLVCLMVLPFFHAADSGHIAVFEFSGGGFCAMVLWTFVE